ncbi:MAG: NUDIX domain-containing protein [Anaerolineaceae bacterium]
MPQEEQGVSRNRYCVIPRVLIFIFRGEEVLLIKGNPTKKIWPNRYNGIGGHIERGEDVLSAARRELKEEAGIQVEKLSLCGTVMVDAGEEFGIALYIYKGKYEGDVLIESTEGSLEWVQINQIVQYPLVEDLPIILPRVHKMDERMQPFSARYYYDTDERLCVRFGE